MHLSRLDLSQHNLELTNPPDRLPKFLRNLRQLKYFYREIHFPGFWYVFLTRLRRFGQWLWVS